VIAHGNKRHCVPLPLRTRVINLPGKRKVTVRVHNVDALFSITYHKVQGATEPNIILVLNERKSRRLAKLVLASLYVGLTRVKKSTHMRRWPARDDELEY
jgi:hypothetical protein